MVDDAFLHRTVPALGRRVHRLGLACNYGIDEAGFELSREEDDWMRRFGAHVHGGAAKREAAASTATAT